MIIVLLILAPLIEIVTFIEIGAIIGAWWTIFLIVATAIIGVNTLRRLGGETFMRFQRALAQDGAPSFVLFEGFVTFIGGSLLIVPGFITDMLGTLCLLRTSRLWIIRLMLRCGLELTRDDQATHHNPRGGRDIEGTFRRRDDHD